MRRAWALAAAVAFPAAAWAAPPPMAAVGVLNFGPAGRCSGTLIAPDLVLTAGHCVMRKDRGGAMAPGNVAFRTGAYPGHAAATFAAGDVVVHPLFVGGEPDDPAAVVHDAALVRLSAPVPAEVATPIPVVEPVAGAPTFLSSYRAGLGERARERRCPILREWPEVVSLSCEVRPGESGSPILVSEGGALGLVAILSASTRLKRTETALAPRAPRLVNALKAVMGGF
jgi:protease YdgD